MGWRAADGGLQMVRKIVAGLVLVLLVYLGWNWYKVRSDKTRLDSGEFTCQGCLEGEAKARYLSDNAGETPASSSDRKPTSASFAAQQTNMGITPAAPASIAPMLAPLNPTDSTGTSSMVAPPSTLTLPTSDTGSNIAAAAPTNIAQSSSRNMDAPPAADSASPNPQNNAHFRGAGSFEWYRQGNITWRVDTTTGHSCIVYATMEEWRKQIVLNHGCGRNV